jgi:RND superfamily putative drug exporter
MTALFEKVDAIEGVKVTSPYSPEGAQLNSADGTISFAQLNFTQRGQAEAQALGNEIKELGEQVAVPGLTVEYGGQLFSVFEFPESELLGILAAVIILLVAFGSVIAMGLPIGTALFGLGVGVAIVGLGSQIVSMPEFSTQMTAMIGLGVGIDYALFIVTPLPREPAQGMDDGAVDGGGGQQCRDGRCCSRA